jgi:membrane protease YdiL (CAAX protease family)
MTPAWFDHALVLCFVVLLPLAGATVTYRRLTAATGDPALRRMRFYRRTLVLQISMLVLVLAAWHAGGREWTQLGVGIPRPWHAIFALAFAMIFVWRFYQAGQKEQQRIALRVVQVEQLGRLAPIMPRTRRELDLFVLLLLVAAASEEVVFRGYLTAYLRSYLPLAVAACIAVLALRGRACLPGSKGRRPHRSSRWAVHGPLPRERQRVAVHTAARGLQLRRCAPRSCSDARLPGTRAVNGGRRKYAAEAT